MNIKNHSSNEKERFVRIDEDEKRNYSLELQMKIRTAFL